MNKRFVAKKQVKGLLMKLILLVGAVYVSLVVTFNILLKNSIATLLDGESLKENLFAEGTNGNKLWDLSLLNPADLLKLSLNYSFKEEKITSPYEELKIIGEHQNDTTPVVYIYNTHPEEYYDSSVLESANIKYSVRMASYILSDYLKDLGIASYVEASSSYSILKNNYEESRTYLDKRLKEYPSIELAIDIHRDAVSKSESTAEVDGKKYAKVLFVVGLDHDNYEKNLRLAEKLNNLIGTEYSRGIAKKTGDNVNGVYNQDIAKDAVLIEIGGSGNTIDEVTNTLELVAKAIFEYRNGG